MASFSALPAGDGPLLQAIRLFFGTYMVAAIALGVRALIRRTYPAHGAWMTRAYAPGVAVGTQAIFLIPGSLICGPSHELSRAIAMGAAWLLNLGVAEFVIWRRTRITPERITHSQEMESPMTVSTAPLPRRIQPTSPRKIAAITGALYLITFVSSIPAVLMITPILSDPSYIVSAGADTQVIVGSLLDLVNALACIGTAVVLFPITRRVNEGAALGFVTSRLLEAAIIVVGVMALFTIVTLRQPDATGADADMLTMIGGALVALRDWTFVFGPGLMPGINALLLGYVLYRSRLVPRIIPALGLIGGPLLISSAVGVMLGINEPVSVWAGIATVPIFFWELSVGVWMLIKGFNPRAVTVLLSETS